MENESSYVIDSTVGVSFGEVHQVGRRQMHKTHVAETCQAIGRTGQHVLRDVDHPGVDLSGQHYRVLMGNPVRPTGAAFGDFLLTI